MWPSHEAVSADPNLLQGNRLQAYGRELLDDAGPHLDLLSITSDPALLAYQESMEGTGEADAPPARADVAKAGAIEQEFNQILAQYTSAYKQFSEATLRSMEADQTGTHGGKVVDPGDGHYVYVNHHGYTHKYSAAAWGAKGRGCDDAAVPISPEVLAGMLAGPAMNPGQPCGLAAKLVKNKASSEMAWVDMKGIKHVFSRAAWRGKPPTCDLHIHEVSAGEYAALPTGPPMQDGEDCDRRSIDPAAWDNLQRLNTRLVELADQLGRQLQGLETEDAALQGQMSKHQKQLQSYVSALKKDKAHRPSGPALGNAVARAESTRILAGTRWYHYWAWVVTAVVVVALTARALSTDDPGAATTLIALVALVVILYNVVRWLYERLSR